MVESIIGKKDFSRYVDVWRKTGSTNNREQSGQRGPYKHIAEESNVEFSAFLISRGFTIIPVTAEEQLEYGCNVLNLGGSRLVSTEAESARRIATHPAFNGTVEYLDFSAVTAMYGGVHCASQVVRRRPH
jgi:arginine deiminase